MNSPAYTYILVRSDLSVAQQAVQACHAALEAGFLFERPEDHPHLVLLQVKDESMLLAEQARLEAEGIPHAMFFEPDNATGYSALATAPLSRESGRGFRRLALWTGPAVALGSKPETQAKGPERLVA
jgi:hypothetical protein